MHPNPAFRGATRTQNIAFARKQGFGALSVNGPEGLMVSHVPFLLSASGDMAELHLVRSNPIAQALQAPAPAVLAITGPHGYISPDWYGLDNQVPTWNYVAVHLRGRIEARPQEELGPMIARLSAHFENQLRKLPWTMDKMDGAVLDRLQRAIVPIRLTVEVIDGTWKLGQKKPPGATLRAADNLVPAGMGEGLGELARMMRDAADGVT